MARQKKYPGHAVGRQKSLRPDQINFCPPTTPRECLDWMLIVSQRHLEEVLGEYCAHYNDERPQRSCGLRPPASPSAPIRRPGATIRTVSYTHLRAHETRHDLVCRL